MKRVPITISSKEKALLSAKSAFQKKGEDIVIYEVRELTSLTEYFVVCSVDSQPQMSAVTDEIGKALGKRGVHPLGIEGDKGSHWVLLDYDDLIVHLFRKEERAFYNLDGLWGDAPKIGLEEMERPASKISRIG